MAPVDSDNHPRVGDEMIDSPAPDPTDAGSNIEAIDFNPISSTTAQAKRRLPQLPLIIGGALLVVALIFWFLLTSRAVSIDVRPAQAELQISGGPSFALADHYLMRPGQYRLQISAEGFVSYDDKLVVTDEDNQSLSIDLTKLPGHLNIVTTPDQASVSLNGEDKGLTPLTLSDLAPGSYQLKVAAPRYFPIEQSVDIEGLDKTTQLHLELKPAWGNIAFRSEPAGATITVAGKNYGATPGTAAVLASGEEVAISLPGYKTWQQTLSVEVGEFKEWPAVTLLPADGQVMVSSAPTGASITLDGQYLGKTPATVPLTPDISHHLNLFLAGYGNSRTQITIKPAETRELNIKLKAKLGSLKITSKPANTQLYINGKLRGTTPMTLSLPAHPWRLEVRKHGYTSQTRSLSPKPGVEQAVHFSLKSAQQSQSTSMPQVITSAAGQKLKLFKPNTTFTMGASRREQGRRANEILREARLTRPFYLATTEVTNAQFRKFRSQHSSSHINGKTLDYLTQPVVNINWNSAALFCNWLSKRDNLAVFYVETGGLISGINPEAVGYRLPTEAEWSWAARHQSDGSMIKFSWGNQFPPSDNTTNIADRSAAAIVPRSLSGYKDGQEVTAPVGTFPANSKGLYDVDGNVAEWLNDYYSIAIGLSGSAPVDPVGPDSGEYRVIRGPSWRHGGISELRLSFRDYGDKARDDLGFRIARYAQ